MKSLSQLMQHLFDLYGKRNAIYLSGVDKRLAFLTLGVRNLEDAIEEEQREIYGQQLASVFARICGVAENFQDLPIAEMMARKYPFRCSYCDEMPCDCTDKQRAAAKLAVASAERMQWSLTMWQTHLNTMYGAKNREKGIDKALHRLFSEVAELITIDLILAHSTMSAEQVRDEYALELCDAIAWLIAIANILEIDIETAVEKNYGNGCEGCGNLVSCRCGAFNMTMRTTAHLPVNTVPG